MSLRILREEIAVTVFKQEYQQILNVKGSLLCFPHVANVYLSGCVTLCLSPSFHLFRTIHYYAELGQRSVFPTCEVPEHFVSQVTVLKYFSHYMEENLMDVSNYLYLPTPHSGIQISVAMIRLRLSTP